MKGRKLMITAVLAFFGFVLLAFSVYLLYKNTSTSIAAQKQKELDEAIKQIEVLHAAGYVQIFTLWFKTFGEGMETEKIGNTKLDQMKTQIEKQILKDPNFKLDERFCKIQNTYKAVNRKVK